MAKPKAIEWLEQQTGQSIPYATEAAHGRCRHPRRGAGRLRGERVGAAYCDAGGRALKVYLDSTAIVKLVQKEAESDALRRYLRGHRLDGRVTSALARVEVVRAVQPGGAPAVAKARRQLARLHQVNVDRTLLDSAAAVAPATLLRSLDAVHVASALLVGAELRAIVTYDARMAEAATAMGLPVDAPR